MLRNILDEQRKTWDSKNPSSIEDIISRHSELTSLPEGVLELIRQEMELRIRSGETPRLEDYASRFPHLVDSLTVEFAVTTETDESNLPDSSEIPDTIIKGDQQDRETPRVSPGSAVFDETRQHQPQGSGVEESHSTADTQGLRQRGVYTIVREHARGGLGQVSVAFDGKLNRHVALKEIREDRWAEDTRLRFLNEAEITGQLEHPGIVPVYAMNEDAEGKPYYVMRFIEGQTMAEELRKYHTAPTAREFGRLLNSFVDLCQALGFAHSKGIIHRDLKPANVMLGSFGETLVLDWGLAKRIDRIGTGASQDAPSRNSEVTQATDSDEALVDTSSLTQTGSVLGTLAYMAPEQARGEIEQLDARCDVFGLGGILCVLLTGNPPYTATSGKEMLRLAAAGDLTAAFTQLDACAADKRLVEICKQCLTSDAADRPANAAEVADAITSYQADVQEQLQQSELRRAAAEATAAEERRRKRIALALAAAVLLLVGVSSVAWWNHRQQQTAAQFDAIKLIDGSRNRIDEAENIRGSFLQKKEMLELSRADIERARELVNRQAINLPPAVESLVADSVTRIENGLADQELMTKLFQFEEEIASRPNREKLTLDYDSGFQRIEDAFLEWGFPLDAGAAATGIEKINGRPQVIQADIIEYLNVYFGLLTRLKPQDERRVWLLALLNGLDNNPARSAMRNAMELGDSSRVDQVASELNVAEHPPLFLAGVAQWFAGDEGEISKNFLERSALEHPDGFLVQSMAGENHLRSVENMARELTIAERERCHLAIGHFAAAISARPQSMGAHTNYAVCWDVLDEDDRALEILEKVLRIDPENGIALNNKGTILSKKGDVEGAIAAYRQAIQYVPNMPHGYRNLGGVLVDNGRQEEGLRALRKAVELAPEFLEGRMRLSTYYSGLGKFEDALAELDAAIAANPRAATAHHNRGVTLTELKRQDEALAAYETAVELDSQMAESLVNIGQIYMDRKDRKKATLYFGRALAVKPDVYEGHLNLGNVYYAQANFPEAVKSYRNALELKPGDATVHYNIGMAYFASGQLVEAGAAFKQTVELNPAHYEGWTLYGGVLQQQGNTAEAVTAYKKALSVSKQNVDPRIFVNMGAALKALNRYEEAIVAFQSATKVMPAAFEPHFNLGIVYSAKRDWEAAKRSFSRAADIDPGSEIVQLQLGKVFVALGDDENAKKSYLAALNLNPAQAGAYCNVGILLQKQGRFAEALEYFTKGHEIGIRSPNWKQPSAKWLTTCQQLLALDKQLTQAIALEESELSLAMQLELAEFAANKKKDDHAAVKLYKRILSQATPDDSLPDHTKIAAIETTLRASMRSNSQSGNPSASEYRALGLRWLQEELNGLGKSLQDSSQENHDDVRKGFASMTQNAVILRTRTELWQSTIPESERDLWQEFWEQVRNAQAGIENSK